jgi:hypothetical protein
MAIMSVPLGRSVSTLKEVGWLWRQFLRRYVGEQLLHQCERRGRLDITRDHENRIVRSVPGVVEALEHLRRGLLEGRAGAERVVFVRGAGEHARAQLGEQHVRGLRQVLRHFLLDGTALLVPLCRRVEHGAHAQCLDVQRHVQILGRHREPVLGQILACVGIEIAANHAADVGELIGGESRAAAEHHVLLGVRSTRKSLRCLIRPGQVVDRGRDHRCQRVADDDHAQAVLQRGTQYIGRHLRRRCMPGRCGRLWERCISDRRERQGGEPDGRPSRPLRSWWVRHAESRCGVGGGQYMRSACAAMFRHKASAL